MYLLRTKRVLGCVKSDTRLYLNILIQLSQVMYTVKTKTFAYIQNVSKNEKKPTTQIHCSFPSESLYKFITYTRSVYVLTAYRTIIRKNC